MQEEEKSYYHVLPSPPTLLVRSAINWVQREGACHSSFTAEGLRPLGTNQGRAPFQVLTDQNDHMIHTTESTVSTEMGEHFILPQEWSD
ncbi:hypothetical protein NLI96_g6107 [Meripilus lineatus]|uniref:Uncharacterized protein n=1 Tax=Meripilus lineatus TaxID=2056292 RepID=A0AAD5V1N8_9APHY|nr:hypothetical protein NLI96_g6107 [Physisporinus lineatus]